MSKTIESLYIHFPFCRHLCNYCDFYKKVADDSNSIEDFHHFFKSSWAVHQDFLKQYDYQLSKLKSLYIGGGTPSLWGEGGAQFLADWLGREKISFAKDAELTLEVNPGSWSEKSLDAWKNFGINRYSLGIQALDSRFLKLLDRVHSLDEVFDTLKKFQSMNVRFSVDFMLGLPYSQHYQRDILQELKEILDFGPDHISLYILTTHKGYIHKQHLPDEDFIADEYLAVSDFMRSQGFLHYEVSNFSKPNRQSFHNLQYWKCESVAALGPSATGFLKENRLRYKWKTKKAEFEQELLSPEAFQLEKLYMALRSQVGLNSHLDDLKMDDCDREVFKRLCDDWQQRGLMESKREASGTVLSTTPSGFLVIDHMMDEIFSRVKSL